MIVSLTHCPICNGQLKLGESKLPGSVAKYICQVIISELFPQTHYEVYISGAGFIQVLVLPPYIIYNRSNTNRTHIHDLSGKEVMNCPLLKLETPEKLLERIKGLIVFS